jgi:hypothetical protein
MKTTQSVKIRKFTILLFLFTLSSVNCKSQSTLASQTKLGVLAGTQLSGNGHGCMYEASAELSNGNNCLSIGALIQKRKNQFAGVNLSYSRVVFGNDNHYSFEDSGNNIQLFFYAKVQYIHNASLSFNRECLEEKYFKQSNDANVNFQNYKTSTVEAIAGFGLDVRVFRNIAWHNSIGIGAYNHLNYLQGMYCEKTGPSLVLSTSLKLTNFIK